VSSGQTSRMSAENDGYVDDDVSRYCKEIGEVIDAGSTLIISKVVCKIGRNEDERSRF
jgi:hypothetical protein